APNVVDVAMGDQDPLDREPLLRDLLQHSIHLQAGIDTNRGWRVTAPDHVAVFTEEIVGKDRHRDLLPERLGRRHPTDTSSEPGVRTSGSASVMSTISSRRTPPQPGT